MANVVTYNSPVCDSLLGALSDNTSYFSVSAAEILAILDEANHLPKIREKLRVSTTSDQFGGPMSIQDLIDNFDDYSSNISFELSGIPIRII